MAVAVTWAERSIIRVMVECRASACASSGMTPAFTNLATNVCDNDDILKHCRGPGPHVRGCWVGAVLDKE